MGARPVMSLNESLYELFLVDQQVRGLEGRLDGARRHARTQQVKLDQLRQQSIELSDQLRHARANEHNLEKEAEGLEERIGRLREQMNSAKNNKEYSAFLVEVNTLKIDKEKIEEGALEQLSRIEALQSQIEAVEAERSEQEKIKQLADEKFAARQAEVGDQLEQVKRHRAEAAEAVPPTERAVFEKLAESLDGEAMAPVEREDPRHMEFTCGGCYMSIPTEPVNQLISQDKLVRCTSCQRILYLDKTLQEAMGSRG